MATRESSRTKRAAPRKKPAGKPPAAKNAAAKPATKGAAKRSTRPPAKAPSKAAGKPAGAKLTNAVEKLEAKFKVLQKERDALKKELAAANERIGQLEAQHTDAVNRIDWVIDSLHNLLEDKS